MNPQPQKDPLQDAGAREVQKFFNKAINVLLLPRIDADPESHSGLGLLFDQDTYRKFTDYKIKQTIVRLFAGRYPILVISVRDGTAFAGLAIRDMSSPLRFTFADQPVGGILQQFMEATPEGAEIDVTIAFKNEGKVIVDSESEARHLLTLKGYFFDHV